MLFNWPRNSRSKEGRGLGVENFDGFFKYEKLEPDAMRIVKLLRGKAGDPICCEINHCRNNERPSYRAVWYMWGNSLEEVLIGVGGKAFAIRNLYDFFQQKMREDEDLALWVDAICIDQTSPSERNHTVSLVNQIYQQAELVYVWLGQADNSSDDAITFIAETSSFTWVQEREEPWFFINKFLHDKISRARWPSVLALCSREYWTWLWIIQEVLLGKSVTVYCGDRYLDIEGFQILFLTLSYLVQHHRSQDVKFAERILASPVRVVVGFRVTEVLARRSQHERICGVHSECPKASASTKVLIRSHISSLTY